MRKMKTSIPLFILILGTVIPIVSIFISVFNVDENIVLILNGVFISLSFALVDWINVKTPKISILKGIIMITLGFLFFIGVTGFLLFSPVSSW